MKENNQFSATEKPLSIAARIRRAIPLGDRAFPKFTFIFAIIVVALLISMIIVLSNDATPAVHKFGFSFFTSSSWNSVTEKFGALPAVYGTLLTSLIALVIAIPVSLGAALFLVELAPSWIRAPGSFLIEMLAAIPSVIIGLWGIFVLVPYVIRPLETWLHRYLGFIPFFHGTVLGPSYLAAGVILAIMIVPIITAVSRDAMRAVPDTQREAMLALGSTRWEMISRAVMPYCRSGLIGGIILGLGRALGETMAVLMVIGNGTYSSSAITASLNFPGTTIASKIASEFSEATSDVFIGSLVELALILFGVTLLVNVIARLLVWRMTAVKAERE